MRGSDKRSKDSNIYIVIGVILIATAILNIIMNQPRFEHFSSHQSGYIYKPVPRSPEIRSRYNGIDELNLVTIIYDEDASNQKEFIAIIKNNPINTNRSFKFEYFATSSVIGERLFNFYKTDVNHLPLILVTNPNGTYTIENDNIFYTDLNDNVSETVLKLYKSLNEN